MKKRLLSLLISSLLLVSLIVPAGASVQREVRLSAMVNLPVISVVVPTSGIVYLNPYELPVVLNGKVDRSSIVSVPWRIENRSEVPLQVNATVFGYVEGSSDMTLSATSVAQSTSTRKLAFLYLDCQQANPTSNVDNLSWPAFDPTKNVVIKTTRETSKKNILVLSAATSDGQTAAGGVGVFRISGDVTPNPKEAWNPAEDLVSVSITFTFTPLPYSKT